MKKKFWKWGLAGMVLCGSLTAGAQQINPMMEAMFRNYADILAENPKDYYTLYDRAAQYLSIGEFNRALSDIEMALEYTPAKDTDYRQAEYSLKCDILTAQKDFKGAIKAANDALAINDKSGGDLYKLGNLYLLENNADEALKIFQRLQRDQPRSQEAFYGMAKANVMKGNTAEATDLLQEIESLGKQSFVTYCRIGDLYVDMNNLKDATKNYVIAYNLEDNSQRPIESLKNISKKNPSAVMEALEGIIAENPDNIALNYVKAILAFDNGDYIKAEKACKDLAKGLEEESPAVYRMLAVTQLAQNNLSEATQSIGTAEKLAPNDPGVQLNKAEVYMSQNPQLALSAAEKALKTDPNGEGALLAAAKASILAGKYEDAQNYLNEMILSNPSDVEALLLRGYLSSEFLNNEKSGLTDYTRAGNIQQSGTAKDLVLAALGKSKAGKKLDAEGMINQAIQQSGKDKDALYLIAVYYAQTGNEAKAREYSEKAIANGYTNLYNLKTNIEPLFNLSAIR